MPDGAPTSIRSLVPARMDRLPWSGFHTRLVVALGITWVLDGMEITVSSLVGPVLQSPATLGLSSAEVGQAAAVYLLGEVVGALGFGYLADRLGRRRLFLATLALYLTANAASAFAVGFGTLALFRFVAGAGIGGEYAAINSAIDELIPAAYRGRTDIAINGTYWLGAVLAALITAILLEPAWFPENLGWRIALFAGPLVGLAIWPLRWIIPESPRWLLTHGHEAEAEHTVATIERRLEADGHVLAPVDGCAPLEIRVGRPMGYATLARVLLRDYPGRATLSLALMTTQSFLYNAVFFTYGLVLTHFYDVPSAEVPLYFYAFATGNLLGPLLLGRFFDTIGRRQMIAGTYAAAGVLLAVSGHLFSIGALTAFSQTVWWSVVFFFASAAASSAYLTVSEIYPLEIRAQAIALIFAIAQIVGATGPWLFGTLIGDQANPDPASLFRGYLFAAAMMLVGAVAELAFGVRAEGAPLEDVCRPLSAAPERSARGRATTERAARDA